MTLEWYLLCRTTNIVSTSNQGEMYLLCLTANMVSTSNQGDTRMVFDMPYYKCGPEFELKYTRMVFDMSYCKRGLDFESR